MPKVYAIIRGNGDILVGSGGNVGDPPAARTGLHLPGGTYGHNESAIIGALREIEEETGILLMQQDAIASFVLNLNGRQVTFVVFEVFSVANVIAARVAPPNNNQYDEPFANLAALDIVGCDTNPGFAAQHGTDWFASGLAHARQNRT